MTQEELEQFVKAVVAACQFSPRVTSRDTTQWRDTIRRNGGLDLLQQEIEKAESKRAA